MERVAEENGRFLELRSLIEKADREALVAAFQDLHPADGAEQLAALYPEEIARYIELVGPSSALTVFEFVPFETQRETLRFLSRETLATLISIMSPDDRADLIEEMDEAFQDRLLSLIIQTERQDIQKLITYPEDSAGAYMTTDYALLRPDVSIRKAVEQLRLQAPKKETIYYVYVVDQARRLIGFVSLRDLIMAHPESFVRDIMHRNVISIRVDEDIENLVKEMAHYDFLAMPVVDPQGRLVGIVTYDDVFDVMEEEATEDMYLLANLDTDEKLHSPVPRSVKLRIPWLLVNLGTALLSAYVVSRFTDTITEFVTLASFMPVVAGLGGNAGTQSLTVVVRALALGEIRPERSWKIPLKEIAVGFSNGIICGMAMALISYMWQGNLWLSLILWMAMAANLVIAGLFGTMIPITLRKLKLDPALGSSIFVTMATDSGGFFIFLGLATLLMHHLMRG